VFLPFFTVPIRYCDILEVTIHPLEDFMKHLPRLLVALGITALVLIAEDFWVKKPYTDWSDKDAAKLLTNSPWSHDVVLNMGAGDSGRGGGGRRGGGNSASTDGNPMGGGGVGSPNGSMATPSMDSGGAGTSRNRGGGGGDGQGVGGGGAPSITLHVRWQSALPLREAIVVAKLGHEKAASDQAKKYLGQAMPFYIVAVVGLPAGMAERMRDDQLAEVAKGAILVRKDKDPITAESAQKIQGEAGVAFLFPKTAAIALDDKEVEFISRVGTLEVKRKFKLKDMVRGDKLEL
jgi:hypothetical protein